MFVNENPVDRVFVEDIFKSVLVVGVESGTHFLVVFFAVFVPGVEGAIHQRLAKSIPKEA